MSKLKVGSTYHIKIDDCCVWGSFVSKLVEIKYKEPENEDEVDKFVFENGVEIYGYEIEADAVEVTL